VGKKPARKKRPQPRFAAASLDEFVFADRPAKKGGPTKELPGKLPTVPKKGG
jgi:hypothetical protein